MDPKVLKAHLDQLCADLDAGRTTTRAVRWAGAALVATGTLTGCFETGKDVPLYGAVFDSGQEHACDDEVDNDADGMTDCDDADCGDDPACEAQEEYGGPFTETDCTDELDDDSDGLIDCDDEDCVDDPACLDQGAYGAPME
ncbi:MAG: hypothetical protein ABIO70_06900 [Pseudomonadota bacterium]